VLNDFQNVEIHGGGKCGDFVYKFVVLNIKLLLLLKQLLCACVRVCVFFVLTSQLTKEASIFRDLCKARLFRQ